MNVIDKIPAISLPMSKNSELQSDFKPFPSTDLEEELFYIEP